MKIIPAYPQTGKNTMHLTADTVHHISMHLTADGTLYTWQDRKWDLYEKKIAARKKAVKAPTAAKSTAATLTAAQVQAIVADMRRCAGWSTTKHTTEKESTPAKSTTAAVTFPDLIAKFNHIANTNRQSKEFTTALTALATAITNSVIKKCIDPRKGLTKDTDSSGCNAAMLKLKSDLSKDLHTLENTHRLASKIAYHKEYTASGDVISVSDNPADEKALSEIIHNETISNGYDLVQSAILRILEELEKSDSSTFDIEKKYTVKRLKRKVRIKLKDSKGGYETVETSAVQESFRSVRREIMAAGSVQIDPRNGYTYIDDLYTTNENGAEKTYYRLPKYADLGGYITDYNGAFTVYTADLQTAVDTDTLIDKMSLTPRQAQILSLRLKGYGAKAIATYLSIKPESVKDALKAIRRKAEKAGLTAEKAEKARLTDKEEIEKKRHTGKADNAENIIHKLKKVYREKNYFHIETPIIEVQPIHCAAGSYTALKRDKIPALYVDILNGCKNPFDD